MTTPGTRNTRVQPQLRRDRAPGHWANASRGPDHAGWYNHTLSISFTGADATSGLDSCTQATYSGPDDPTASVNGTCRDRAGNTSSASAFNFQYDETDPNVTATPSRAPDSNGWYNHTLTVSFNGTDATSGLESCVPAVSYSGPDSANASVSGTCTDHAGNSGSRSLGFSYDDTVPQVTSATPSRSPDHGGWYNHTFSITFAGRTRLRESTRARRPRIRARTTRPGR